MTPVDLLVWPRWIVPVVPRGVVLDGHGLAVRDGEIVALVAADGLTRFDPAREVHLPNHVLLPGLVNAHTHVAMNLMRGVGDDLALLPWLEERIWPIEGRFVDPEFVADGTDHALAEMIRGGVTTANDMYFFPDVTIDRARAAGFRMIAGCPVIEFPTAWADTPTAYIERAHAVLGDVVGDPLVGATISPHAPYTVSDESLLAARRLADRFNVRIDIHLHETKGEVERAVEESGVRPFERIRRLGIMDERLLAVHMTDLTAGEIGQCAESGITTIHCPESNLKLGSGICRVPELLEAGVNVALGTDGAASNNDLDMIGEMRTAALIAKGRTLDPTVLPAPTALELATINGARALGLEDRVGSLEPGKRADLVAIDLGVLEAQPIFDVVSHLVYATGRHQVTDVWIDGRRVLVDRSLVTLDEATVCDRARSWHERIMEALT